VAGFARHTLAESACSRTHSEQEIRHGEVERIDTRDPRVPRVIGEAELAFFQAAGCTPDLLGLNHYLTSERYVDHRLNLYPSMAGQHNGRYVDLEAVRMDLPESQLGPEARLREVGLDPERFVCTPGREGVVVRIPGRDRTRGALLVHGHLDVVPAQAEDWSRPPFAAEIDDDLGVLEARLTESRAARDVAQVRRAIHEQVPSIREQQIECPERSQLI
jgi:hypothetical protein